MYDPAFIEELKELIGFGEPIGIPTSVVIDNKHLVGTSGRTFAYFHRLVNLENLYQMVRKIGMSSAEFNDYLDQMKEDVVKSVLSDLKEEIGHECDYSENLQESPYLLENLIGYYMATTAIEEMVSTSRKNRDERNAVFKYDKLKIELEGLRHDSGHIISEGLKSKKNKALVDLKYLLCGHRMPYIEDANCW